MEYLFSTILLVHILYFLSRTTAVLAAVFFATSLTLAYIASNKPRTTGSVMQDTVKSQAVPAPADKAGSTVDPSSKTKDIPK
jgi:preprotein translocase subunit SecG